MISLLVAHDREYVIGKDNELPWHIPEDLAYFKRQTMGKAMVMGRKTFESIGRPLPGRKNIVLTGNREYHQEGVEIVHDLDEAIRLAGEHHEEVMIIGGEQIFRATLPLADRLYITYIDHDFEGDTFFPEYGKGWKRVSETEEYVSSGIPYRYQVYERSDANV
ncbi:dihydrofolate reductase [Planomicrobium sp. YIM 101495]|uniref:dihydrofolate reductase n=1 Tax=Planomicrobium sp. YIM 101495 TaxID=2665160 RepID=UPI0012B73CCB|nr:dihydrofolate reductase [Planomicrobium sp. YIM 101495]MTD29760.1 dihydrofolate reductase [Planomicrobium sp. YIM 101495]